MKKFACFVLIVCFFLISRSQQWYSSFVPYGREINSVKILRPDGMVAAGGRLYNDSLQSLFRTGNEGLSWEMNPTDCICSWIRSIAFTDTLTGYAVGFNGKMMNTGNGGRLWNYTNASFARHFFKVVYASPQTLFVTGGTYSEDSSTILKSTNGGYNWTIVYNAPGAWLRSAYFIDTLNGFAVGDSGIILHTTNGGANWNNISSPVHRDFYGITFISANEGFIVGGEKATNSVRTILHTTNGGNNWAILKDEAGGLLTDINFHSPTKGHITGDSATLLTTTTGGSNWTPEVIPNTGWWQYFTSVDFYSDTLGIIGTKDGNEYIYNNVQVPQATTGGAEQTDITQANIHGEINSHGAIAQYYFTYSTDSFFSTYLQTVPENITSYSMVDVSSHLFNLLPDTIYYYYITAQTLGGAINGSTQHFYTGEPFFNIHTLGTGNVSPDSALLNGFVQGFQAPANIFFEYDTNVNFTHQVTGVPPVVSDTGFHLVSASIYSLLPNTTYFYRIKAVTSSNTFYSNTSSFYIGSLFQTLQTLSASTVTDTSAVLNGEISGFVLPVNLSFEYGTSLGFGSEVFASVNYVNDTMYHHLNAGIFGLQNNSTYYYRLKGQCAAGTIYANTNTFQTGPGNFTLTADLASGIGNTSAVLNATVDKFYGTSITLVFQYDTSFLFGSSLAAVPGVVSDSMKHLVSLSLTGLQNNTRYYYRLQGVINGVSIYSNIRQFFTGANQVPNWDFENWDNIQTQSPWHWLNFGNMDKVPSYDGTDAIYLYGNSSNSGGVALTGLYFSDTSYFGGAPFTARPDSMIFFAKYDIAAGDTAFAMLMLHHSGNFICQNAFPVTGNSGGVFKRLSYPVSYMATGNPDTIINYFSSSNFISGIFNSQSWIMVDNISFAGTSQNVPNPGFNQWDSLSYDSPQKWSTSLREAPVSFLPFIPITKTSDAYSGAYAIRIQNIDSPAFNTTSYITTDFTHGQHSGNPAFAISHRYQSLNGYMKWQPFGDTMTIYIDMYKSGNHIGLGALTLDSAILNYRIFEVPISYTSSQIPDSSSISFRTGSENAFGNSVLYLDNLGFDGFYAVDTTFNSIAPGIIISNNSELFIFPNPANNELNLVCQTEKEENILYRIFDLTGKVLLSQNGRSRANDKTILHFDVSGLPSGMYLINVSSGEHNTTSRFNISK